MSTAITVWPAARPLRGHLRVPGDKSISHRALLVAARASGRSRINGLSPGDDVRHTLEAVTALGAGVEVAGEGAGGGKDVYVSGGPERLHEPAEVIDVGNSGTGIRLIAGFAAALDGLTVLAGDSSVARRPMDRVVEPLRLMGARVDGREGGRLPPLVVRGGDLRGVDYTLPVASAQVKSALLIAGLAAREPTTVREPVATRAHTEEMLADAGARIEVAVEGVGSVVTVHPGPLHAGEIEVPADPSQAAFWAVAACIVPGSDLVLEGVYVGRARAGFVGTLQRMGARIEVVLEDPSRHTADIHVQAGPLVATTVDRADVPSLIDEIPILAVAAAQAEGATRFTGAAELRVKETDRLATTAEMLSALGVRVEPLADGFVVEGNGGAPLNGGSVSSQGDHRIAMAAAVGALAAEGPVRIAGWDATATSYPAFEEDLQRCLK
ncbi:MAG TPA: 3-phosphoshikimate 1-carboxyvinyltransferase [Acidimicrobiales bacterium]|nr:3-phosphoshikimate 1-carboxyvinyltransferase [Acidimicrobiales bacterium]